MDYIVLEGVAPYDGRYELAVGDGLTTREWGWIKRLAGYLPTAVDLEALGDPEFVCVLAAISLRRAGRVEAAEVPAVFERLADAPPTAAFRIESDDEQVEEDAGPPPASSNGNDAISGGGSATSSETPAPLPRATGPPSSATSVSGPSTSVT